jgi:hypothetical protein
VLQEDMTIYYAITLFFSAIMLLYKLLHHIMVIVPKKVASQKKHKRIITIARSRFEILSPLTDKQFPSLFSADTPHIHRDLR